MAPFAAASLLFGSMGGGYAAEEEAKPSDAAVKRVNTVVQVPVVLMPVSDPDGNLINYAYILVALQIANSGDRWSIEERIPYIKDAFIRVLHDSPNMASDLEGSVNQDDVREKLLAKLGEIVPPGVVNGLVFRDIATTNRD